MLTGVADDDNFILFGEGDLLDVAGVGNLVAELFVVAGQGISVDTEELNIVLHAHHHDDGIF